MPKKFFIILIIVLSIAIVAFVGWYFILRSPDTSAGEVIRNTLPFGEVEEGNLQLPIDSGQQMVDSNEPLVSREFRVPTANLFRISDTPVAGAVVFIKNAQAI